METDEIKPKPTRSRRIPAMTSVAAVAAATTAEPVAPARPIADILPGQSVADLVGSQGEAAAVIEAAAPPEIAATTEIMEAAPSPAVQSDSHPAAETPTHIGKGQIDMATIAPPVNETTERAQAVLGDMQGRMKSTLERTAKMSEDMVDFAKGNVEAMMASARAAAKAGEVLGQEAADYSRKSLEHATAAFRSFATVKSPTELFQLQSDYAKASFDNAVAEASKMSEAMMKFAGEIAQPLSNRYALATEKIKATV